MTRIYVAIFTAIFVLPTQAMNKKIKFDYLFQIQQCSKDDDNIDGCESNIPTGRQTAEIALTDIGDGRSVGTWDTVTSVEGINMKAFVRVFNYSPGKKEDEITEFFVSFSDDHNSRAALGFTQVNGLEKWNNLYGIYGRPFKLNGINIYPEFRMMPVNWKLINLQRATSI
ncbi:MAG: hypothetical protein A4S09_11395 [Proteobacteria bacterium SG_bin7]|nr:MAG: hypothetical protein A4S09_11395 [Proteobacteria bacterium SG_bin7]